MKAQENGQSFLNSSAVDYLVSSGLKKRDSDVDNPLLKNYLSEIQEKKVEEYCNVFGVSVRTMLNSCIQYIIFLTHEKGVEAKNLLYYPKRLGSHCHEVILNAETLSKLKNSGLTQMEEASKYAVAGINILYDKNLNIRKTKSRGEKS